MFYKVVLVLCIIYCMFTITKNWLGFIVEIMKGEKEHKYDFAFLEVLCLVCLCLAI